MSDCGRRLPETSYGFYVDDIWKISTRLTINVGLQVRNHPAMGGSRPASCSRSPSSSSTPDRTTGTPTRPQSASHISYARESSKTASRDQSCDGPISDKPRYGGLRSTESLRWIAGQPTGRTDNNDCAPRFGHHLESPRKWVIRTRRGNLLLQDTGNPDSTWRETWPAVGSGQLGHQVLNLPDECGAARERSDCLSPYSFANHITVVHRHVAVHLQRPM